MRLNIRYDYPAGPDQVYAMMTDLDYLRALSQESGDIEMTIEEHGPAADGFRVVNKRTVAAEVPGFAKKFVKPTNTLTQTSVWPDAAPDGSRVGTWKVDTKGVPIAMSGTMTLTPAPSGTVAIIEGEVTSSIPLVGGKLADFVAKEAKSDLDKEYDFALRWLKERTG